jgi:hypothetical protein
MSEIDAIGYVTEIAGAPEPSELQAMHSPMPEPDAPAVLDPWACPELGEPEAE